MRYTYPRLVALARSVGFGAQAPTMAAISMGESGGNSNAVGDSSLADAKWGPSIGLTQVRSLKAQLGTGKERDANRLRDPRFNMRSALTIYRQAGNSFSPWTVYNTGAYRKYLKGGGKVTGAKVTPILDLDPYLPATPDKGGDSFLDRMNPFDPITDLLATPGLWLRVGLFFVGIVVLVLAVIAALGQVADVGDVASMIPAGKVLKAVT